MNSLVTPAALTVIGACIATYAVIDADAILFAFASILGVCSAIELRAALRYDQPKTRN